MRLLATSDLHYDNGSWERARSVSREAKRIGGKDDVLILAGDISTGASDEGRDTEWDYRFDACLDMFRGFPGRKLAVVGNHCLWVNFGDSSEDRYAELAHVLRRNGFHPLDESPVVIGDVGFAGNVGWYDYSFRSRERPAKNVKVLVREGVVKEWEELDAEDYGRKSAHVITWPEGRPGDYEMGLTGWNDGLYIKWGLTDGEFLDRCVRKLDSHLAQIEGVCSQIVAVTHHLPFREMVERSGDPAFDFNNAYMGSSRLGDTIRKYPKARTVIAGHSHKQGAFDVGGIKCYNVSGGGLAVIELGAQSSS